MTEIHGTVAPKFEKVRDTFQKNFDEGKEIGAAFSAYHRGEKVVDLWGGIANADTGAAWVEDTLTSCSRRPRAPSRCALGCRRRVCSTWTHSVVEYWPSSAPTERNRPVSYLLSIRPAWRGSTAT
jgi:hypothetical protein